MCLQSHLQTSPPTEVISEIWEPQDNFGKYPPLSAKIQHGVGGSRFFFIGILIFRLIRSPCKISEQYDNLFWQKSKGLRRKKKKKEKYYVHACSPRAAHALRSDKFQKHTITLSGLLIFGLSYYCYTQKSSPFYENPTQRRFSNSILSLNK